jgi:hypothetical protein
MIRTIRSGFLGVLVLTMVVVGVALEAAPAAASPQVDSVLSYSLRARYGDINRFAKECIQVRHGRISEGNTPPGGYWMQCDSSTGTTRCFPSTDRCRDTFVLSQSPSSNSAQGTVDTGVLGLDAVQSPSQTVASDGSATNAIMATPEANEANQG